MKLTYLDGAMGTQLQARGLRPGEKPEIFGAQHPDILSAVHSEYIEAGSRIIYANTFGANRKKLGDDADVPGVIAANIQTARAAAEEFEKKTGEKVRVALDIGPLGELLEPLGTLPFEEAYTHFAEMVKAGNEAGPDLIVLETFTDLLEAKAGLLAAKEHSDLPVWVTMSFEADGRTFLGVTIPSMAATLDALGADAIGINCSLGPKEILPLIQELSEWTDKPLIAKPNAGLPDPRTGAYGMDAEDFAAQMVPFAKTGAAYLGGCCGTTPAFIRELAKSTGALEADDAHVTAKKRSGVCSAVCMAEYGSLHVVGERINPTGNKQLTQALKDGDLDYIKKLAIEQQDAGADVLDINVGVPGIDEKAVMQKVVTAVQSVCDLPLQIDSSNPEVIEAGLRLVNGRAIVNSVNGEEERMEALLPIAKRYGAAVIGLTMDQNGIPQTADERLAIADRILERAGKAGIREEDMIIDCLTLTVSAQQNQAAETLKAVRKIHDTYGLHAALGISNISFGLPDKIHVTENFLIQALANGVDFPIANPCDAVIADALSAFRVLSGEDKGCKAYMERFAKPAGAVQEKEEAPAEAEQEKQPAPAEDKSREWLTALETAILKGNKKGTEEAVTELLPLMPGMEIINTCIIPSLDEVGKRYESGKYFLPQLMSAAAASCAGLDIIKKQLAVSGEAAVIKGRIILATVQGDVHDIGKNIVKVILENYGYEVIDLGKDVAPEKVVETVKAENIRLVGLSALMTTTVPSMQATIEALKAAGCTCKVMVGGAVLTESYAKEIGADYYTKDAQASVAVAKEVLG